MKRILGVMLAVAEIVKAGHAAAQSNYPEKPVRIVVGFPAGTVDVKTRLLSDDRTWLDEAACAGAGVIRFVDLTVGRYLSAGLLVPVLTDWEALEAPTIFAVYRRSERHSKLIRVFLDFLVEVFAELEAERTPVPAGGVLRVPRPEWDSRVRGRHSTYAARGRKSRFVSNLSGVTGRPAANRVIDGSTLEPTAACSPNMGQRCNVSA